ncbi:lipoate--protein ligase family protein [Calditrichota bacterium GD2]
MQDVNKQDWVVLDNRNNLDPAINLAIEEYAVRHLPGHRSYFLVYRNRSSVIVGKHQSVLLEVNLPYCWENKIPIFRRISGGGTVYHDPGNLNLSFITQYTLKNFNQYRTFLQPVVEFFNTHGLRIDIDERNNLRLNSKKISGNAQFTSRDRMLSHGTLLISSNLQHLKRALKKPEAERCVVQTRATASIKSAVTNIAEETVLNFDVEFVAAQLKQIFGGTHFEIYHFSENEWAEIKRLARQKYMTWQWNIAESPAASIEKIVKIDGRQIFFKYRVENGIFRNVEIVNADWRFLADEFEAQRLDEKLWLGLKKLLALIPEEKKAGMEYLLERWF